LNEKAFLRYVLNNDISQEQADTFISRLNEFSKFLKKENNDIDSIPSGEIIKYADIEKDTEIVGMLDHIEIWNPERLTETDNQFTGQQDEMDAISDEIFS